MAKKIFLLTDGRDCEGGTIYGLIIGDDLTKEILKSIWKEAFPIHCRKSREYHAAGRQGDYFYDWEIFMTLAFDRGYEVLSLDKSVTGAPEIPLLDEFVLGD